LYYKKETSMPKRELSDPITLRLPVEVLRDIETIAAASDRTRSWVMVRALRHYLAGEGADVLAAVAGRREIAEGRSHDFGDVVAEIEAIAKGEAA
jgi:predicted transcriptional regulator